MRLLHIIPSAAPELGGPSTAVVEMSAAQARRGHAVTVSSVESGRNLTRPGFAAEVVHVDCRLTRGPLAAAWEFSAEQALWLRRSVSHYDAVHIHAIYRAHSFLASRLARSAGVPYVVRPAGSLNLSDRTRRSAGSKRLYWRLLEQSTLAGAHAVHATSESEAEQICALGIDTRVEVVPHGVAADLLRLDRGDGFTAASPRVLYLGRVAPKKGLDRLIAALAHLPDDVQLDVAGRQEEPYASHCRSAAADAGVANRVRWHGHVGEHARHQLLAQAAVFVLPSEDENFGIAVLEAMAAALPVIVSKGVALGSVIAEHRCGVVAERDPESLAEALHYLLTSPSEASAMGSRGRAVAAKQTWDAVALRLEDLYA